MSSTLIAIIISAVLAFAMLISFFVGMKRGVKRSLLNLGISAIMLLTAFLITPVITNALMGIQVSYNGHTTTVGTIASYIVSSETDFGKYLENSQTLENFVNGIGPAIAGILVFVILCFVLRIIGQIVYAILNKFCFKSRKQEEEEGLQRARLGGGLLSIAKTFLFFVCVFLPLTSLTCLLEQNFFPNYAEDSASAAVSDTLDSLPTTEEISNKIPKIVKRIVAGYNRSAIGYPGQLFGIHNVTFDYISQMEINGEKVSIRQSTQQVLEFYNYALEIYDNYKVDSTDFFKNMNYTRLDTIKKNLFESGTFKGFILNTIYDFSQSYETVLEGTTILEDYRDVFEDIKVTLRDSETPIEDLKNDFYKLADIVKSAGQSGFIDDLIASTESEDENLIYVVADKYMNNFISDSVDSVFNIKIVRGSFESILDKIKDQLGDSDMEVVLKKMNAKVTNWEQFIYDMKDILTDVADLYDHINDALKNADLTVEDFMEDKYLFLKADPQKVKLAINDIGGILDKVNALEIMKDSSNNKLLPEVLDSLGFEDILDGIVAPAGTKVNYTFMFKKLSSAISYLLEFDLYDEVKAEDYTAAICKIADEIYEDSLLTHEEGTLSKKEKLESIFSTLYEIPKVKEITIDSFKDSLSSFVDISVLDDSNVRSEELGYMTDILISLAKNKITVDGEQVSFLKYILTDGNDFEGLIKSIETESVDEILTPIFASKMTNTICGTIFDSIQNTMRNVTEDATLEISYEKAKLIDENAEICKIFKDFLTIYKNDVQNFDDVNYVELGALLNSMKENAYRVELLSKENEGIFKGTFDAIIAKAEAEYSISFTKTMDVENIYDVDFESALTVVQKIQENKDLAFVSNLKELLSDGEITDEKVKNVLDSITTTDEVKIQGILTTIIDNNITINVGEINIAGYTDISEAIDSYSFTDATKEYLKSILTQE